MSTSIVYKMLRFTVPITVLPFGLVVRIPGFHPGGPGSIPGMGIFLKRIFIFVVQECKLKPA